MKKEVFTDLHRHAPARGAVASGLPEQVERWIAEKAPGAFSVGLHPWNTEMIALEDMDVMMARVAEVANNPRVVAIGEAGIDALRGAPIDLQREILRRHIVISEMLHKPLVLHIVKAVDDVMALRREMKARQPWVWHGFRGNMQQAAQWLAFDEMFYISLGEKFNCQAAKIIPIDRLLIETDESEMPISEIAAQIDAVREYPKGIVMTSTKANLKLFVGWSAASRQQCSQM